MKKPIPVLITVLMVLFIATSALTLSVGAKGDNPESAALNQDFVDVLRNPSDPFYGYMPQPMDLSHLKDIPVKDAKASLLPSSFDWRASGKVTSVKDQRPCGTCWAFGTTSVLESAVLIGENAAYNFSEQSVALCVDRSWTYLYDDSTDPCNAGGNSKLASEVFIKNGSVLESCNPYNPSALNCDGSCVCDSCPAIKKVDGYRLATNDGSQIDVIKNAVYNEGPVTVAYKHSLIYEYWDNTWGAIYDYYPCYEYANHLISIIGWNDSVPHPNPRHGGTGAWLVKNSWGSADSWAGGAGVSDGYFYLAYDSSCVVEVAYLEYKDPVLDEELLYWDEAGHVNSVGYTGYNEAWMAGVFTADEAGDLTHVDFWTTSNNAQYELYVWEGYFGTELAHQTGTCSEYGYYSVPLSTPIARAAGQQFTVGVKMTTPGFGYPISVEEGYPGLVDPPIQTNVSFIRHADSDPWVDLADYDWNACLRARMVSVIEKPDLVIEKKWEEPALPKKYLHPEKPIDPREQIKDPIGTYWHELYPEYCNGYELSSWKDDNGDGVLSPCDRIDMTDASGNVDWYHVDEMTVTLFVSLADNSEEQMAIEFVGGYEEIMRAIYEPVCTYWHEVHPVFCPEYHITEWKDSEEKGLSYCDFIFLVDLKTGRGAWYHVDEVTWDIIVSPTKAAVENTYVVSYTIHNKGTAPAPAGHSATLYVDGTVVEHKVVPVDLKPCETYTDTFRTVVECTAPGDTIEVCADNYDVVDELNERNNCIKNEWECPCKPSIDVEKTVRDPETGRWVDEVTVPVSTIVRFRGVIHNDGTCCNLTEIVVDDVLSDSLEYKDNATVDGKPWEPVLISPNTYRWKFPNKVLQPCQTITIEFDAHAAKPGEDVNVMYASGVCEGTGEKVEDKDTATVNVIPPPRNKVYFVPQHSVARGYCKTTEVEIWVNATGFAGGQINMTYDPTCANVTKWVRNTTNFLIGGWMHDDGREWITFSTMTPTQPPLLTGEYMIGTLTIHCVSDSKEGCKTPLDFIEPSTLFDDGGKPVPANFIDGTFECKPGLCGDVAPYPNCNEKVDMGDVILLLNNVSYPGTPKYVLCNEWAGDCRCSGKIDMGDVILLLNNVSYPGNPKYVLDCCETGK